MSRRNHKTGEASLLSLEEEKLWFSLLKTLSYETLCLFETPRNSEHSFIFFICCKKKICLIPALPVHSFFSQTLQHKVIYIVKTEPGFILSWFRHVYLKRNMTMLYFLLLIGLILFRWDICRRCIHIFFFFFFSFVNTVSFNEAWLF